MIKQKQHICLDCDEIVISIAGICQQCFGKRLWKIRFSDYLRVPDHIDPEESDGVFGAMMAEWNGEI